jgi:hypothetical protein
MNTPFWLPEGHILKYGERKMRFEEALGDDILRFRYVDGDEEIVLVPLGRDAVLGMPRINWIIEQFRAGAVVDPDYNAHITDRNEGVLHLDRAACEAIDPLSGWRYDWADAAIRAGIKKTEEDARFWIRGGQHGGKSPQPRSLLRWMHKLNLHGGRIGALVSTAGREKGESQLPDIEDRLVHKWAMRYWRPDSLNGRLAHKENAAALMIADWDELKELGVPYLNEEPPSDECVRRRINSLECYSTHASRYGRPSADKKFSPSGEPVEVERPFERMFMDGVFWEHSVHYSEDLKIPAAKMKSVITMDAFSQWVAPHPTFAGKFRPVWGLRSLRGVMLPPAMTPEEIAEDPELAMIYGIPSDVMYDRDRTMIAPRMVPGAIKLFSTIELAEAYHSDAKAKLENYHKFVKAELAMIPGRILGPGVKHSLGYNPIASTEVTRAQYVDLIEQCRRQWNSQQKKSLGNRSPNDIMKAHLRSGGLRLTDPKEVMRTFASVPKKPCVLTVNGLTYDNVHYRFNRDGVGKALSSNHHKTPFGKRLTGTARIEVSIRVWDDDIDMIEVFDDLNQEYFPMWSTDPGYTGGLNRWEHQDYQKALRSRKGATKHDKLRNKARRLNERQRTLTGKSFREREEPVELLEAEERRLSGKRAWNPACAQVPELGIPTHIDGAKRNDIPKPPPQTKDEIEGDEGAADVRSDPSRDIAQELGDDEAILHPGPLSWAFPDGTADDDEDDDEDEDEEGENV